MNVAKEASEAWKKLRDSNQRTMTVDKLMPHLNRKERINVAQWMHNHDMIVLRTQYLAPSYVSGLPEMRIPYRAERKTGRIKTRIVEELTDGGALTTTELEDRTGVEGRPIQNALDELEAEGVIVDEERPCLWNPMNRMHIYTYREPISEYENIEDAEQQERYRYAEKLMELRRAKEIFEETAGELNIGRRTVERDIDIDFEENYKHPLVPGRPFDMYSEEENIAIEIKATQRKISAGQDIDSYIWKIRSLREQGEKIDAYLYAREATANAKKRLEENGIQFVKLRDRDEQ